MNIKYKIKFHTYWHCGSGLAAGADADLLVIKDKDRLPYVPGKTIKGLVREAVDLLCPNKEGYIDVFGEEGNTRSGSFFSDAVLPQVEREFIASNDYSQYLFQNISSTAITDEGVADPNTLRKIQVSIPCELEGEILNIPTEEMAECLTKGLQYIKRLGAWRNRGLGRCTFEGIKTEEASADKAADKDTDKNLLKFRCELLTDVILSQRSASEGSSPTLDFIPGSNFLGIAAGGIYGDDAIPATDKLKMFHTKCVRFGDAHPANGDHRSLRMPACLYFPKGAEEKGRTHYVHHAIEDATSEELRNIQLKQERSGFADFMPVKEHQAAIRFKVNTDYAIKSAYDRSLRRSRDEQMFGYQSMGKGMVYYFTVEIDPTLSKYADRIKKELEGRHRVGHSRSAQYGLVDIKAYEFDEPQSGSTTVKAGQELVIYADSRLIFLDDNNQPTFQPTGQQLTGNKEDVILWEKSQLRTFQYAPYNYQRRCFDTDRCGIEKGSVIVVRLSQDTDISQLGTHLGSYQNEGFGKVIYNPDFLKANHDGTLAYQIVPRESPKVEKAANPNTPLTNFVAAREEKRKEDAEIYAAVNEWVNNDQRLKAYTKESFASQWGHIRDLALQSETNEVLLDKLFRGEHDARMPDHQKGYLVHGVAKDKWAGKTQALKDFINKNSPRTVVNLASEMQKKCK